MKIIIQNIRDFLLRKKKKGKQLLFFEKIFKGKVSYKKIDKYVDLVRMTIDPDDDMQIEFDIQDDYQHIKIAVFDRVLN